MFKFINHYWQKRRERFYLKNRWHLILEFSLGLIIILLVVAVISLHLYRPNLSWSLNPITAEPIKKIELDLNNPPLIFNFSSASSSLRLADGLELKINLKNTSRLSIQNIKIDLIIIDKNFTLSKIENFQKLSGLSMNNNQITLASLMADEEREVAVKVYFKARSIDERIIKWQAQNEYLVQAQVIRETLSLPDIKLASELNARALAYYNSPQGDQLGSGPLPPVVGLPTNYWLFFEVKSMGNFKNLVFSAKLPKGVELTERRSLLSGDFKYNSSSRQLIWKVSELKNQNDDYRLGFEIQLMPDLSQLGKVVNLLSSLKYYASDTLTNEEVSAELPNLTTNLDFDRLNKGQGEIQQP